MPSPGSDLSPSTAESGCSNPQRSDLELLYFRSRLLNNGRTDFKRQKEGQTFYYNRSRLTFLKLVGGVGDTGLQERLLHGVRALLEHHVDHLPDNR